MIKAVHITNFQSHEDSYIEFHPGVNVLVADSRFGKSAVLRSMFWCFENKPTGDKFRSRWGGDTTVTVYFPDGHVSRTKAGSDNSYSLTTKEATQEYTGFGQAVPEPIANFLNMDKVNFQRQMDRPFMLDWGPRERGAYLNEITNLEIIDKSIAGIKKIISTQGKRSSFLKTSISDLETKKQEFSFLGDLEKKISNLEILSQKMKRLEEEADDIMDLVEKIETSEKKKASFGDVEGAERSVAKLEVLEKEFNSIIQEAKDLESVIQDITQSERIIETKKRQVADLEKEFQTAFPDICPLCGK